jgi:5-methylcytosine-specific restriction endonuclease McrA
MVKKIQDPYVEAEIEHQENMKEVSKDFDRQQRIAEKRIEIDVKKERYLVGTKLRKVVLDKFGHKCRDCGSEEDVDSLEIHHKDMDNDHTYLSNLILLCFSCHAKRHKAAYLKKYYSTGMMGKFVKKVDEEESLK